GKVIDGIGDVRLRLHPIKPIFGADVDLEIWQLHPEAAPSLEILRFRHFTKSKQTTIKLSRLVFGANGDGDLRVVYSENHKNSLLTHFNPSPEGRRWPAGPDEGISPVCAQLSKTGTLSEFVDDSHQETFNRRAEVSAFFPGHADIPAQADSLDSDLFQGAGLQRILHGE